MASTNKTTNYELSQFIETDRPAWLTDYNGDMRKLDTALKAVSDVASGASGGISSLTDRMTAAEGAITTNANDITALDARADALEAGAQSTAGTIANIQTEQTAQNLGIEAATELGYNLARPYDSASTYAVGAYVLFQNTLYKCVTAVSTGEAFDPTKWIAIKATDEISSGGVTFEKITFDNSDLPFIGTPIVTIYEITNFYNSSATSQKTITATNVRIRLNEAFENSLVRFGRLRILTLAPYFEFDQIVKQAKTVYYISGVANFDPAKIDNPNKQILINQDDFAYGFENKTRWNISKTLSQLVADRINYNNSASTVALNSIQLCVKFVYTV